MVDKIKIGNLVIDDPIVVEYSYSQNYFYAHNLSQAIEDNRYAIAYAFSEKCEQTNDYLPIGVIESYDEVDNFIRRFKKAYNIRQVC